MAPPFLAGCEAFRLSGLGDAIGAFAAPQEPAGNGQGSRKLDRAAERALVEDSSLLASHAFEDARPGHPPGSFSTHSTSPGSSGRWIVEAHDDAPVGSNVLAGEGPPAAEALSALLRDAGEPLPRGGFVLRTRLMIDPRGATQAAGLALNANGAAGNGHGVLLDVAGNQVVMERVHAGVRRALPNKAAGASLATSPDPLSTGVWYELKVRAVPTAAGPIRHTVHLDGEQVFAGEDLLPTGGVSYGFVVVGDTRALFDAVTISAVEAAVPGEEQASPQRVHTFTFDELAVGAFPPEFRMIGTGEGRSGRWAGAPGDGWSPMMIRNHPAPGGAADRLHLLVLPGVTFADGGVAVLARVESGDPACRPLGAVFRYVDEHNHHRAVINTATDTVTLIRRREGVSRDLASAPLPLSDRQWYHLEVVLEGPRIGLKINGEEMLHAWDRSHGPGGMAGLFAHSATEAGFGEFAVTIRE